jgi:hypothetical protein
VKPQTLNPIPQILNPKLRRPGDAEGRSKKRSKRLDKDTLDILAKDHLAARRVLVYKRLSRFRNAAIKPLQVSIKP